jgi:hypothetical protein
VSRASFFDAGLGYEIDPASLDYESGIHPSPDAYMRYIEKLLECLKQDWSAWPSETLDDMLVIDFVSNPRDSVDTILLRHIDSMADYRDKASTPLTVLAVPPNQSYLSITDPTELDGRIVKDLRKLSRHVARENAVFLFFDVRTHASQNEMKSWTIVENLTTDEQKQIANSITVKKLAEIIECCQKTSFDTLTIESVHLFSVWLFLLLAEEYMTLYSLVHDVAIREDDHPTTQRFLHVLRKAQIELLRALSSSPHKSVMTLYDLLKQNDHVILRASGVDITPRRPSQPSPSPTIQTPTPQTPGAQSAYDQSALELKQAYVESHADYRWTSFFKSLLQ